MNRKLFNLFLPRGAQYIHQSELCSGWQAMTTSLRNISVLYKKSSDTSDKTVILAHPYVSAAKLFFIEKGIADIYLSEGINVVLFDFNGFGQSAFRDFNFYLDICDVYTSTINLFTGTQVILHGVSFGAAQSLGFMSQGALLPRFLVLESCPSNRLDYFRKRNKSLYYTLKFMGMVSASFSGNGNYLNTASKIAENVNITLLYGIDDQLTPVSIGKAYKDVFRDRSKLFICRGGHIDILQKDFDEYKKALFSPL